jgi:hypothetical protein
MMGVPANLGEDPDAFSGGRGSPGAGNVVMRQRKRASGEPPWKPSFKILSEEGYVFLSRRRAKSGVVEASIFNRYISA